MTHLVSRSIPADSDATEHAKFCLLPDRLLLHSYAPRKLLRTRRAHENHTLYYITLHDIHITYLHYHIVVVVVVVLVHYITLHGI